MYPGRLDLGEVGRLILAGTFRVVCPEIDILMSREQADEVMEDRDEFEKKVKLLLPARTC